jgi:hypothetical protein
MLFCSMCVQVFHGHFMGKELPIRSGRDSKACLQVNQFGEEDHFYVGRTNRLNERYAEISGISCSALPVLSSGLQCFRSTLTNGLWLSCGMGWADAANAL